MSVAEGFLPVHVVWGGDIQDKWKSEMDQLHNANDFL